MTFGTRFGRVAGSDRVMRVLDRQIDTNTIWGGQSDGRTDYRSVNKQVSRGSASQTNRQTNRQTD